MADPTVTPLFGVPTSTPTPTPTITSSPAPADAGVGAGPAPLPEPRKPKRQGFVDDALGFLGDFLLSRLRMGTPYRDAKKNEQLQIASEGFDQNPDEAFRRMAAVDWNAASKFRDQYIDNTRLAAQNASTAEARDSRLALAREAQTGKNRGIAASYFGSLTGVPEGERAATYAGLRSKMLSAYGGSDPELANLLPETYDPIAVDAFLDSTVPVGMQRQQRLTKTRIDNQDEQFDRRDETTRRGQDITSGDKAAGRAITTRGQDIRSSDTRRGQDVTARGQDIRSSDTRRGQDMRPQKFVPDPNKVYVQGGRRYRYNPSTKKYDPID